MRLNAGFNPMEPQSPEGKTQNQLQGFGGIALPDIRRADEVSGDGVLHPMADDIEEVDDSNHRAIRAPAYQEAAKIVALAALEIAVELFSAFERADQPAKERLADLHQGDILMKIRRRRRTQENTFPTEFDHRSSLPGVKIRGISFPPFCNSFAYRHLPHEMIWAAFRLTWRLRF